MSKGDPRFIPTLVKIPRELLARLDAYAEEHCGGNRSFAIRRAIEQMIGGSVKSSSKNPQSRA